MTASLAQRLADSPNETRAAVIQSLPADVVAGLQFNWEFWARPDQLPPPGTWRTWLLLGGRGSGKTRSSAEWIRAEVEAGRRRQLGVIGPTADSVRRTQIEGPSGLLAICPPWCRPSYEPSTRRVVWPNGAVAHLFSAEEPDRLRGPNLDGFWGDESTSWANASDVWDMVQMALRIPGPQGHPPQGVVSTTPKRQALLKAIMAAPSTVITRARTSDNAANLDASTLAYLRDKYGGTTLGRQELDAEILDDVDGALWNRAMLDAGRVRTAPDTLRRVIIGIDPAGGTGAGGAETGIVAAATGPDGHGYVLRDASGRYTPDGWARRAVDLFRELRADKIVAERNYGGAMVEGTIRAVNPYVPVKMVSASRGKAVRTEPIVSLYEQRRVHHVGQFSELEDQLCGWDPSESGPSPDRLDALVWALSEAMLGSSGTLTILHLPR